MCGVYGVYGEALSADSPGGRSVCLKHLPAHPLQHRTVGCCVPPPHRRWIAPRLRPIPKHCGNASKLLRALPQCPGFRKQSCEVWELQLVVGKQRVSDLSPTLRPMNQLFAAQHSCAITVQLTDADLEPGATKSWCSDVEPEKDATLMSLGPLT